MKQYDINGLKIVIKKGDITQERVDAIVNAANEYLKHGGGLAGIIVRKGGNIIQEESNKLAPIKTGDAVTTTAGALPCRYVIHAVGPIWKGGNYGEPKLLRKAIRSSIREALKHSMNTIAIPAISTGIFGYPMDKASKEILTEIKNYAIKRQQKDTLKEIRVVLYDDYAFNTFLKTAETIFK